MLDGLTGARGALFDKCAAADLYLAQTVGLGPSKEGTVLDTDKTGKFMGYLKTVMEPAILTMISLRKDCGCCGCDHRSGSSSC